MNRECPCADAMTRFAEAVAVPMPSSAASYVMAGVTRGVPLLVLGALRSGAAGGAQVRWHRADEGLIPACPRGECQPASEQNQHRWQEDCERAGVVSYGEADARQVEAGD
jgi:hypothetical protein